jgi:multidrug efflux pump subunit AcrA (membrane-fusion protein)
LRLGGSVVPDQIVNLTAQMPGDVSFVAGQEGDAFRQGEVLVSLDPKTLLAKREQILAQIASAEAGYRNALVQYRQELVNPYSQGNTMLGGAPGMFSIFSDPARSLMGQGDPDVERGSNLYAHGVQVETAANAVNQANAALRELDESLQNANSYAPFDGVILKKMVEQGDIVQPGMPLVSFADITRLQIRVEVPTRLLRAIQVGHQVQASLDGQAAPIPVRVDRIFPMADAGGHTTTVKFALPDGVPAHSGMYAEVMLPDPDGNATALPTIPESAMVWRGSLPAVYKVEEDGSIKLRLIRVGEQAANGMFSVVSGIRAGDRILEDPSLNTRASH